MNIIKTLAIIAFAFILSACDRVPSNVHVLSTSTCGSEWKRLDVGSTVPKHSFEPCGYNTAIPNWPMTGEAEFRTQFANQVTTRARFTYVYSISEPIAFIGEARYLGKMGGSLEISDSTIGSRYEMAENTIIDKLLRELTTEITRDLDLVTADTSKLEAGVQEAMMKELKKKGIEFGDIALTLEMDDLTKQAIDTTTAVRIYSAAGIETLGKDIMKARAGATQIVVNGPEPHGSVKHSKD